MAGETVVANPRERAKWMVKLGVKSGSPCAVVLGDGLRDLRRVTGMTQKQAAEKAGVSDSIWATWETGKGLPGEQSWRLLVKGYGKGEAGRIIAAVTKAAEVPGAGEPVARPAVKAKAKPKPKAKPVAVVSEPVPDGWGGWEPEEPDVTKGRNVVRGADTDDLLGTILRCGLPDKSKALLCAAVVAMAAGVGVEVEIRARA